MTKYLVMAQGRGSRWNKSDFREWNPPCLYKQFIQIGNNSIITRTLMMLHKLGQKDITVIAPVDFIHHVNGYAKLISLHPQLGHLHQGINESYPFWKGEDEVTFLYGDVVYAWDALQTIVEKPINRVTFYGRSGENTYTHKKAFEFFGISVPPELQEEFKANILTGWRENRPRIWGYTYTALNADLVLLDTYSDDIDSPEEYTQFYPILLDLAMKDDEGKI